MARTRFRSLVALSSCTLLPLLALATPAAGQCSPDSPDTDCNANGLPDACELTGMLTLRSGRMSPFDTANPRSFTIDNAPEALEDLLITFRAAGDLSHWTERVDVWIDDTPMQSIFVFSLDCADVMQVFALSASLYNAAAADGQVTIHMVPSSAVNGFQCPNSYIEVELDLVTHAAADENGNGVIDECETATLCEGMEPTVYVDADGFVVGGPLDGKPYFGVLIGTSGSDVMMGTDGDDMIVGGGGDDAVCGNGGNDHVAGAAQGPSAAQANAGGNGNGKGRNR